MTSPLFVTSSKVMLPNWRAAFAQSSLAVGVPERFDSFDSSIIFLDYMNLSEPKRADWLSVCLDTQRKVIVLSPTPSEAEGLKVINSGALGYGHTLESANRLQEMVMVVSHGGLWTGRKLLKHVLGAIANSAHNSEHDPRSDDRARQKILESLTPREQAVAKEVATGATNFEIAEVMSIKERTVKMHITSIFEKLKIRNRVELALLINNVPIPGESIQNRFKFYAP